MEGSRTQAERCVFFFLSCTYPVLTVWDFLIGFGNETATFILECAEDENDDVVSACRQLKDAVEAVSGKIDGL